MTNAMSLRLHTVALQGAVLLVSTCVFPWSRPVKPVRIIVPFPAGGSKVIKAANITVQQKQTFMRNSS